MLQPKRTKYRKTQKGRIGRIAQRGYTVVFGTFGLKALEPARITSQQIEAVRVTLTRTMKREGAVYPRIFPDHNYTQKSAGTRMGSGKGSPAYFAAIVKPGTILYEAEGIDQKLAEKAFRMAGTKLPIKTKLVYREDYITPQ